MQTNSSSEVGPENASHCRHQQAVHPGNRPTYAVLALKPGGGIREIALSRSIAAMQALSYMPIDELRGAHCAIVVTPSDLPWWQICSQSLRDSGVSMQPFTDRQQAMTWLAFIHASGR